MDRSPLLLQHPPQHPPVLSNQPRPSADNLHSSCSIYLQILPRLLLLYHWDEPISHTPIDNSPHPSCNYNGNDSLCELSIIGRTGEVVQSVRSRSSLLCWAGNIHQIKYPLHQSPFRPASLVAT